MEIRLKDLNTVSMALTEEGMELGFYDNGKHIGDLKITPTELIWNRGQTVFGKPIGWPEIFEQMQKRQNPPRRK